jgi:hypothetical protein
MSIASRRMATLALMGVFLGLVVAVAVSAAG